MTDSYCMDCGELVVGPLHTCRTLTERLAQVERERDTARAYSNEHAKMHESLIRERDDAKAAAEFRQATIQDLRAERDAALADAKRWSAITQNTAAKAEAAEQSKRARAADYITLTDLRSRIEALAAEWRTMAYDTEINVAQASRELRALLHPPKAETAAELLDIIEDDEHVEMTTKSMTALAKLRKLLENT